MSPSREQAEVQRLAEALRSAYGEGASCPSPALFLEEDALGNEERDRLAAHVAECPACAAERELALEFLAPVTPTAEDEQGLDSVLSALRERCHPSVPEGAALKRAQRRWLPSRSSPVPLAMAASVLLAGVLAIGTLRQPQAPELPAFDPSAVMRGARVELLSPQGPQSTLPSALAWREIAQASSYRLTVLAVDDRVLWSSTASASPLPVPLALQQQLRPAVRYRWQVEALGASGPIAASELVDFRIDPRYDRD